MTKRFGFTLAEVLITLGIIGVVAAMTIPTLIANTNGAKFRSQFKKTISTLNQAGLMGQAQYDFDYAGTDVKCLEVEGKDPSLQHPQNEMTFCSLLNGTLTGQTYIGAVSGNDSGDDSENKNFNYEWKGGSNGAEAVLANGAKLSEMLLYTMADGAIVGFHNEAHGCQLNIGERLTASVIGQGESDDDEEGGADLSKCIGFIDVNGVTLPNKEVSCTDVAVSADVTKPCAVKNDANHMTDIFPVVFHDATVEPASNAAKYVLTTAK